jgi:serine protease AprX
MRIKRRKVMAGVVVMAAMAGLPAVAAMSWDGAKVRVVVNGDPGTAEQTRALIENEGGRWIMSLDSLDGGIAEVPAGGIAPLRASSWVRGVVVETGAGSFSAAAAPVDPKNIEKLDDIALATNARNAQWTGVHGQGVDVAIIDSGVTPANGMQPWRIKHIDVATGKLVAGSDAVYDKVGHGTHMACIITCDPWGPLGSGLAYGSNVVSVNVTNASGGASLSEVLAGIDAVIKNRKTDGLNIRVMLMALGFDSASPSGRLVMIAAESAVRSGIVVVGAAGNSGQGLWRLDAPAASNAVIAVGAENLGEAAKAGDEWTTGFSSVSSSRTPDVIAPGQSVRSVRVPGSLIDEAFPEGRNGDSGFLGSGTSQAAAVVAALTAKLLSERPTLKPEEVKAIFKASAHKISGLPDWAGGAGAIDYENARWTSVPSAGTPPWAASQPIFWGSYDPIKYDDMAGAQLDGTRWTGTRWTGTRWTGTRWTTSF